MFDDFEDNGGEEEDSSDAEYADIDATADDNVFGGTQKDKTSVSEKESIVFLVDCAKTNRLPISKNYFYYGDDADDENTRESEQTQKSSNYVQVALNAYRNVLRDRVVCTPDDEIGLVFYNTKTVPASWSLITFSSSTSWRRLPRKESARLQTSSITESLERCYSKIKLEAAITVKKKTKRRKKRTR